MLTDIAEKLERRERLSFEDGVRLFEHPDLLEVAALANRERERRHGDLTYYNYNIRIEATNVCVASCLFCSFARLRPGDPGSYTMSLEDAWEKLRVRHNQPLTEVHVVNGLHPDLPFDYYLELLRGFKRIRPEIHLKCFTAVEIAFFADLYGMTDEQVLRELMAAGLASLPGGGAEVFAERVRRKICHDKADADRWLSIHRTAHRLGMKSNVTMLYGHIETNEERVDHMLRARALQDETGGFQAFIPLAFHPDNNQMRKLPAPSRLRHAARARRVAPHARQHPARQGVLDRDRRGARADSALVRRRRHGRHRAGGKHLSHGWIAHAGSAVDRRHRAADPRRRPGAGGAGHVLQRRAAQGRAAASQSAAPA